MTTSLSENAADWAALTRAWSPCSALQFRDKLGCLHPALAFNSSIAAGASLPGLAALSGIAAAAAAILDSPLALPERGPWIAGGKRGKPEGAIGTP